MAAIVIKTSNAFQLTGIYLGFYCTKRNVELDLHEPVAASFSAWWTREKSFSLFYCIHHALSALHYTNS